MVGTELMMGVQLLENDKSHVLYLQSRIKPKSKEPFSKIKKKLFGYIEKLDKIPDISIILKVTQYIDNLDLFFDLDEKHVKDICPFASEDDQGLTLHFLSNIYVGANREDNKTLGTIAHELTHMVMQTVFKNDCNPYRKFEKDKQNKFQNLALKIRQTTARLKDSPTEILMKAFDYDRRDVHSELIARVPHILAQYPDGKKWLETEVPNLLKFYMEEIVPECKKFIKDNFHLLKEKSLIKKFNEDEGEIPNLKKYNLYFHCIEEIKNFQKTTKENFFVFITNYTRIGLLRILQGFCEVNYVECYDRFLVSKLENCIKYLVDVEYLFKLEAANMLVIECGDINVSQSNTSEGIRSLIKIAKIANNKKLIFVVKEEESENLKKIFGEETVNDVFVRKIDENFTVCDLETESKIKILSSKILFQGTEIELGEFLENEEHLFNIIDTGVMQDIIDNKKIRIGKPFSISSLEGAYTDIVREVNFDTFKHEIKISKDNNKIFLICGMNETNEVAKFTKLFNNASKAGNLDDLNLRIPDSKRVLLIKGEVEDDHFRRFCNCNPNKKTYFLRKERVWDQEKFILLKLYNPNFYFQRKFLKQEKAILKKEIIESKDFLETNEAFLISVDGCNKLRNYSVSPKIFYLEPEKIELEFDKRKLQNQAVHVFKIDNNQHIWNKSSGSSLKYLRQFMDPGLSEFEESELMTRIKKEKAVIFADEPGMGKTTSITKLCEFENNSGNYWVIRLNLKDNLPSIAKMNIDINITQVKTFLTKVDPSLKHKFCEKLLELTLNKNEKFCKELLIVFDGFDELLDENDRNKAIGLFKFLKEETKCRIWITTRLHCKEILEDALMTFAIKFVEIDDELKRKFIRNYFKDCYALLLSMKVVNEVFKNNNDTKEESVLWKYSTSFIKNATSIFRKDAKRFIGTPLQLNLLLEDSFESFQDWVNNQNSHPNFSYLGKNLFEVYQGFFNRKYEILFRKKNIQEKSLKLFLKRSLEKTHYDVARSLIFKEKLHEEVKECESLLLLAGILTTEGNRLEFIHFTFREYVFTNLLMENLINQNYDILLKDPIKFFVGKALSKNEYGMVRSFFNEYLSNPEKKEMLRLRVRKEILDTLPFSWTTFNLSEKNSNKIGADLCGFCVAIAEKNDNILDFLFSIELSDANWSALLTHKGKCTKPLLHLAILQKNDFAYDLILRMVLKYNLDKRIEFWRKFDQSAESIISVAAMYGTDFAWKRITETVSNCNSHQPYELILSVPYYRNTKVYNTRRSQYININALKRIFDLVRNFTTNQQFQILSTPDKNGKTALYEALEYSSPYAFDQIIQIISKFDRYRQLELFKKGKPVPHLAIQKENDLALNKIIKIVENFSNYQKYNFLNIVEEIEEKTMLYLAIQKRNYSALELIFSLMSNCTLEQQQSLLSVCSKKIKFSSFGYKFESSDVENKSLKLNKTVLHEAIKTKNDIAFNWIIESVLKFKLTNQFELFKIGHDHKGTVLHTAVKRKNNLAFNKITEMASQYPLEQQYELLNMFNESKETIFHFAVKYSNSIALNRILKMVEKLSLDLQLDLLCFKNNKEETALCLANKDQKVIFLKHLYEMTTKFNLNHMNELVLTNPSPATVTIRYTAFWHGNTDIVDRIIAMNCKLKPNEPWNLLDENKKSGIQLFFLVVQEGIEAAKRIIQLSSELFIKEKTMQVSYEKSFQKNSQIEALRSIFKYDRYDFDVIEDKKIVHHFNIALKNDYLIEEMIKIMFKLENQNQNQFFDKINELKLTILYLAVEDKYHYALKLILKKLIEEKQGQLLTTTDRFGSTILDFALKENNTFAVNLIRVALLTLN